MLEELRGWPANRPPQRAHIPTGQGSGLFVCVCVQKDFLYVYAQADLATQRKSCNFVNFLSSLLHSPLLSLHRRLTLYAVTCDKPDGKAVFAVMTVKTICIPLSKLRNKSQKKVTSGCVCVCGGGVTLTESLLKDRPGN